MGLRRSSSDIVSSRSKVLRKPQVSCGSMAASRPPMSVAADAGDLAHEAREEDRVASLVDLLGGEEVLLLLARRGVDVGRQAVGHRVLAPEEERVVPERRRALELGELLLPLAGVLGEVDRRRAPVALLPARVQVVVADDVRGRAHRYICTHGRNKCTERCGSARAHTARDARADRRARLRRRHAPGRRQARRRPAVRHHLLVRLQGGAASGDAAARRARGDRAARATGARPRAARVRRGRVGGRGGRGDRRGPRRGSDPPRRLHGARARGHAPGLARRGGRALARRPPAAWPSWGCGRPARPTRARTPHCLWRR